MFETNAVTGADLLALSENVRSLEKRDCYWQLDAYLHSGQSDMVCLLFGLRRTGKTTMLRQAVLDMVPEDAARTAYIKATVLDTMAALNRDMKRLRTAGFKYVLLDEATLTPEFIDSAALFSDIYAAQGMKIVLSGTDTPWDSGSRSIRSSMTRPRPSIPHSSPIGSTAACLGSTALMTISAMAGPSGREN